MQFGITSTTEPFGKTIGTIAPGRQGVPSKRELALLTPVLAEGAGQGEGAQQAEGTEAEGEGDAEKAAAEDKAKQEEIDEDELMFVWNKREAPQHRQAKVTEELRTKLAGITDLEEHIRSRRMVARAADDLFFATIGKSEQHPMGTLVGGQQTSFVPTLQAKPTSTIWEGQHQTVRWNLQAADEDAPEDRLALLPIGQSTLDLDPARVRAGGLITALPGARAAGAALLRGSLGPSKLEMPPDADPHYLLETFSKTAKGMSKATAAGRPDPNGLIDQKTHTSGTLEELRNESKDRVAAVKSTLRLLKDAGEKLDVPSLLVRKLNYLKNPRFSHPPIPFRSLLSGDPEVSKGEAIEPNPRVVQFNEYEVGQLYEQTVQLINKGPIMARARVLPPPSANFSVSLVHYLGDDGLIAPGMHCSVHVKFRPDSLSDYEDVLAVVTERGIISLPLVARRLPPNLNLPGTIAVGNCFVDGRRTVSLSVRNQGGAGRFLIIPDSEWPNPPEGVNNRPHVDLAPFRISPAQFALGGGEAMELRIDLAPDRTGPFDQGFRMVCDNCAVHRYVLSGMGFLPGLQALEVGSEAVGPPISELRWPKMDLDFAALSPGAVASKSLSLLNRTPLPMSYRWEVRLSPSSSTARHWQ